MFRSADSDMKFLINDPESDINLGPQLMKRVVSVMQTLEALRILKTKLAAIDQEHDGEFAVQDSERESIDAKAEAQALSAIFDFLKECKITLPDSHF